MTSQWGYTGEWWDADAQLLYLRARWLDVGRGRFTQRDPSGLEANLYLYAAANPIRFVDPSGYVYLTFDDGPDFNDRRILDILYEHDVRATFFFIGNKITGPSEEAIVWRVAAEGHRLGNHSYEHQYLPSLCWDELVESVLLTEDRIRTSLRKVRESNPYPAYVSLSPSARDYVNGVIEHGTGLLRAPYGKITWPQVQSLTCMPFEICNNEGMCHWVDVPCDERLPGPLRVFQWTVDPRDYEQDSPETILGRVQNGWCEGVGCVGRLIRPYSGGSLGVTSNSDIILFHSTSVATVEALDDILIWLKDAGYTFDLLEPSWSKHDR